MNCRVGASLMGMSSPRRARSWDDWSPEGVVMPLPAEPEPGDVFATMADWLTSGPLSAGFLDFFEQPAARRKIMETATMTLAVRTDAFILCTSLKNLKKYSDGTSLSTIHAV